MTLQQTQSEPESTASRPALTSHGPAHSRCQAHPRPYERTRDYGSRRNTSGELNADLDTIRRLTRDITRDERSTPSPRSRRCWLERPEATGLGAAVTGPCARHGSHIR